MATKRIFKRLPFVVAGLAMALGVFINVSSTKHSETVQTGAIGNYSTNASTYYNSITATSGKQLAAQLHDLITSTHGYYTSYDDNGKNLYQQQTDKYYENGSPVSGYIYEFYSGVKWPNAWDANAGSTTGGYNREHCWCQSNSVPNGSSSQLWGTSGGGSDMHHLRPTENRINSTRGNDKYGTVSNRDSNKAYAKYGSSTTYHAGYSGGSVFEPLDSKKGDVARIIMYVYLHYNSYTVSDLFGSYGTTNGSGSSSYFATSLLSMTKTMNANSESAALTMLLNWNTSDPVDEIEQRRNEQVAIYQGNRNPFIDNSNYANLIWGSGSSSSDPSATISPSSTSVVVDGTVNLTATLSNVTNTNLITWTSSDTNKATVAKGNTTTSSSVATVTGVAAGSATIYCKYNGTTIASATVTVTSSGGSSGSSNEYTLYSGSISEGDYLIVYDNKAMNTTNTSNRLMYETVSATNNKITTDDSSIVWHIAQNNTYWTIYNEAEGKYAASTSSNNQATLISSLTDNGRWTVSGTSTYDFVNKSNSRYLRENTTYGYGCYATSTGGALSLYKQDSSGSSEKTLSSISVATAPKKTTYTAGEYFNPAGLVINRNYSDSTSDTYTYSDHTSEFAFSPTISTALTTSHTSVTITYGGKSCSQAITVTQPAITSITASVSKTFYVGETISAADITIKDNNNNTVNSFTFANDGYRFTYEDASSGGALTNKTFTNAVTGSGKTCSLTVQVQRKAYVAPSTVKDTITASMLTATSTSYTNFSGVTATSDAVYAGNSAKDNSGNIQMRSNNSNSGIVSTTSGGTIKSVKITVGSGSNTINVYGKNTAYSSASDLYNNSNQGTFVGSVTTTGTVNFTTGYAYLGIRSNSGAIYVSSVEITYGSDETPANVANYIMYTDTTNQCLTKLSNAVTYLGNLSSSDLSTFASSNDYVISTARERLNAWAASQGKTINYSNATMSNKTGVSLLNNIENNNAITLIIIISLLGATSIGVCFYLRKKREN